MKNVKKVLRHVHACSLFLFLFGCTVKDDPSGMSSNSDSHSHTEQLLKGLGNHDTTVHGVTLPDIAKKRGEHNVSGN
jgi:hypothetical protein